MIQLKNLNLKDMEQFNFENENELIKRLHKKDTITSFHCMRVKKLSLQLGESIGLSYEDMKILRESALYHDIGKIAVDGAILNKTGALSKEEWIEMKKHPVYGELILLENNLEKDEVKRIGEMIRHHHEHYNGRGYPYGLCREDIPLLSRLISVIDVFDALISKRPYREAYLTDEAQCIMKELSGKQLDPWLTEAFFNEVLIRL